MSEHDPSQAQAASIRARLKYASVEEFIEGFGQNVSRGGVFIKTSSPRSVGTKVRFCFQISDGAAVLDGLGEVEWVRQTETGDGPAGMGIRFQKVTPTTTKVIERIEEIRRIGAMPDHSRFSEFPGSTTHQEAHAETTVSTEPLPQQPEKPTAPQPSPSPVDSQIVPRHRPLSTVRPARTLKTKPLDLGNVDDMLAKLASDLTVPPKPSQRSVPSTSGVRSLPSVSAHLDTRPLPEVKSVLPLPAPEPEILPEPDPEPLFTSPPSAPEAEPEAEIEPLFTSPPPAPDSEPTTAEMPPDLADLFAEEEADDDLLEEVDAGPLPDPLPAPRNEPLPEREEPSEASALLAELFDAPTVEAVHQPAPEDALPDDGLPPERYDTQSFLSGSAPAVQLPPAPDEPPLFEDEEPDVVDAEEEYPWSRQPVDDGVEVLEELEELDNLEELPAEVTRPEDLGPMAAATALDVLEQSDVTERLDAVDALEEMKRLGAEALDTEEKSAPETTTESNIFESTDPELFMDDDGLQSDPVLSMGELPQEPAPDTLPEDAVPDGLVRKKSPKRKGIPLYDSATPPPEGANIPVPEAPPAEDSSPKKGFFKKLFGG